MKKVPEIGTFIQSQAGVLGDLEGELEGAFLAVTSTFQDMGIRVSEGYCTSTVFTFYLSMDATVRWYMMARALLSDQRGYVLRIGRMLVEQDRVLKFQWMVMLEADNILRAADSFRKSLYCTWDLVKKANPRSVLYETEVFNHDRYLEQFEPDREEDRGG